MIAKSAAHALGLLITKSKGGMLYGVISHFYDSYCAAYNRLWSCSLGGHRNVHIYSYVLVSFKIVHADCSLVWGNTP